MKKIIPDISNAPFLFQHAFLIYRPKSDGRCEEVFYNQEASKVLSNALQSLKKKELSHDGLCSFCNQWKRLFDKACIKTEQKNASIYMLDTFKSDRRIYSVKGLSLSNHKSSQDIKGNRYIFILERMQPDKINLSLLSRQFNLNQRERDIVRLLIKERGNKEIAEVLGLSLNTIKSYLKILMRKLGVSSRAGIITCLLSKR